MRLAKVIRNNFAFQPERSKRFFRLRINLKADIPISSKKINKQDPLIE